MPLSPDERIFELSAGRLPAQAFEVLSFQGREGISRLYHFDVRARIEAPPGVELEPLLLGQEAHLTIRGHRDVERHVSGIVTRLSTLGPDVQGHEHWDVRVQPKLWLSGKRRNCRIFQHKSVLDIVKLVLDEARVEHLQACTRTYARRLYCVQYHETDLQFVRRLLAEEGIYFYFEHPPAGPAVLVMADTEHAYRPIEGLLMPYFHDAGLDTPEDHVHLFGSRRGVRSGKSVVREFDWQRPSLHLSASATTEPTSTRDAATERPSQAPGFDEATLEVYDHYDDLETGEPSAEAARVHLERLRARAKLSFGESRSRRLFPGARLRLEGHPVSALDTEWTVLSMTHRGARPGAHGAAPTEAYGNTFECIPAKQIFRPKTPRRRIQQSIETATVVGPKGHEIHTDEHGRIKVQFHWDREGERDEHSSCWIRVMQPWAGSGWGFQFIPRVGMEVLVLFLTGDADKPIVVGAAYNAEHPVPFALPGSKTKSGIKTQSTKNPLGYNELSFEDRGGRERIHVHAERDLDFQVKRARSARVGASDTTNVGGDQALHVGQNRVMVVGKALVEMVGEDCTRTIGASSTLTVGGAVGVSGGSSLTARIAGEGSVTFGKRLSLAVGRSLSINTAGALDATVGGAQKLRVSGDQQVNVAGSHTSNIGSMAHVTVTGELSVEAGAITLRAGGSTITLSNEGIHLKGSVIALGGSDEVSLTGGSSSLSLDGDAHLQGGTTTVVGSGSTLELGGSATMQAGSISLKSGGGQSASTSQESGAEPEPPPKLSFSFYVGIGKEETTPAKLSIRDRDGNELESRPASAAAERLHGHLLYEVDPDAYEHAIDVWFVDEHDEEHHAGGPFDPRELRRALVSDDVEGASRQSPSRGSAEHEGSMGSFEGMRTGRATPPEEMGDGEGRDELAEHLEDGLFDDEDEQGDDQGRDQ
jgi:type VI secretion system secreted protein VgrG